MNYSYLLNTERTALLSRVDVNIISSYINSRHRVNQEEFKKAIEVTDCPFAQEGCMYEFIGVGGTDGDINNVEEVILAIKQSNKCGIGILDKELNFNVIIEPINEKVAYISNRCLEVIGESITLYFREDGTKDFSIISNVSVLELNVGIDSAVTDKITLIVYYRGEDIILPVVRGKRSDDAMFTDLLTDERLSVFAKELLENKSNNFDKNTEHVLNLAISKE